MVRLSLQFSTELKNTGRSGWNVFPHVPFRRQSDRGPVQVWEVWECSGGTGRRGAEWRRCACIGLVGWKRRIHSHRGHRVHREVFPSTRQPPLQPGFFQIGKDLRLCVLGDLCGRNLLTRARPKISLGRNAGSPGPDGEDSRRGAGAQRRRGGIGRNWDVETSNLLSATALDSRQRIPTLKHVWIRVWPPPHGQAENATASSAGVLAIRTGTNTLLLYGTIGTGAEVSLTLARRKNQKVVDPHLHMVY